jgi:hypothetical protein
MAFYDNGIGKIGFSAKTCTIFQTDGNTFICPLGNIVILHYDITQAKLMAQIAGFPAPVMLATNNAATINLALKGRLLALHGPFDKDPDNGDKFGGNSAIHLVK